MNKVGRVGPRKRSGIPRSTGTSREPSPSRYGVTPPSRGLVSRGVSRGNVRPLMTEQILRQSREAESALADALVSDPLDFCLPIFTVLIKTSMIAHNYDIHQTQNMISIFLASLV